MRRGYLYDPLGLGLVSSSILVGSSRILDLGIASFTIILLPPWRKVCPEDCDKWLDSEHFGVWGRVVFISQVLRLYLREFATASTVKQHSLSGGSKNRNFIPHSSESYKSEIKVLAGSICSEGPSPWLIDGHLPLVSSHGLSYVHVSVLISCISLKISLSFQAQAAGRPHRASLGKRSRQSCLCFLASVFDSIQCRFAFFVM